MGLLLDIWWTKEVRKDDGVEGILRRAANPSDTLLMRDNLDQFGIYVLHGDADDNVPVSQARIMRESLATSHPDWTYYERPGAGHWWGDQCMDWPPMFEFLRDRSLRDSDSIDEIRFVTLDPRASSSNHWRHQIRKPDRTAETVASGEGIGDRSMIADPRECPSTRSGCVGIRSGCRCCTDRDRWIESRSEIGWESDPSDARRRAMDGHRATCPV